MRNRTRTAVTTCLKRLQTPNKALHLRGGLSNGALPTPSISPGKRFATFRKDGLWEFQGWRNPPPHRKLSPGKRMPVKNGPPLVVRHVHQRDRRGCRKDQGHP